MAHWRKKRRYPLSDYIIGYGVVGLVVVGCVWVEIIRWHAFEEVTHTSISYLKYMLLFGGHK